MAYGKSEQTHFSEGFFGVRKSLGIWYSLVREKVDGSASMRCFSYLHGQKTLVTTMFKHIENYAITKSLNPMIRSQLSGLKEEIEPLTS